MNAERAIENLLYRYAQLIDAGDLAGLAQLFSDAVIAGPDGSEHRGRNAVLDLYTRSTRIYPETGTPCTQHVTSNVHIALTEDQAGAEAESCFTVFQALPDFPLQAIIAGRYRDRFARRDGAWRFERREIQPTLLGDLSRHLLFDPENLG